MASMFLARRRARPEEATFSRTRGSPPTCCGARPPRPTPGPQIRGEVFVRRRFVAFLSLLLALLATFLPGTMVALSLASGVNLWCVNIWCCHGPPLLYPLPVAVADGYRVQIASRNGGISMSTVAIRRPKQARLGGAAIKVSQTLLSPSWMVTARTATPLRPSQPKGKRPVTRKVQPPSIHTLHQVEEEASEDLMMGDDSQGGMGSAKSSQHLAPEVQVALAKEIRNLSRMTQMRVKEEARIRRHLEFGEWASLVGLEESVLSRQMRKAQQARSMLITTNVNVVYSLALQYYKRQGSFPRNRYGSPPPPFSNTDRSYSFG